MDTHAFKVVAFDCDGVLFDSTLANQNYYNHILNYFNLPEMNKTQFEYAHMHTVGETLAFLITNPETLAAADQYRQQISYEQFLHYMVMEPHLRDLLAGLRPKYKTAIATNRTNSMTQVLSSHKLEADFDIVVTSLDVRYPKPHPECLQLILSHFNVHAHEMVFIGDSKLDAMASRSAGIPFIAYNNKALEADVYIDRLSQVADLLNLDNDS